MMLVLSFWYSALKHKHSRGVRKPEDAPIWPLCFTEEDIRTQRCSGPLESAWLVSGSPQGCRLPRALPTAGPPPWSLEQGPGPTLRCLHPTYGFMQRVLLMEMQDDVNEADSHVLLFWTKTEHLSSLGPLQEIPLRGQALGASWSVGWAMQWVRHKAAPSRGHPGKGVHGWQPGSRSLTQIWWPSSLEKPDGHPPWRPRPFCSFCL